MNTKQITCSNDNQGGLVCPWQFAPFMDNLLRPIVHNPTKLFRPYVKPGMRVLDVGCGAGFASLGLAELVGEEGQVISADLQPKMIGMVKSRAAKAGFETRIHTHVCDANRIGVEAELDFALAFFMLHEVPDDRALLEEVYTLLKARGLFFLTEPKIHVSKRSFERAVEKAQSVGFIVLKRPFVRFGRAVLLVKS